MATNTPAGGTQGSETPKKAALALEHQWVPVVLFAEGGGAAGDVEMPMLP